MNDHDLVALLGAMEARALQALLATLHEVPPVVPTLQAWLAHAVQWERDRRRGLHYPLRSPIAAVALDEVPHALLAARLLGATFRHERREDVQAVRAFFDGVAQALAVERAVRSSMH